MSFVRITDDSGRHTVINTDEVIFLDGNVVGFANGSTLHISEWSFNCLVQILVTF